MAEIDFAAVAASLLTDSDRLVRQWLPRGKLEGREYCVGNIKGDKGRSLKVNLDTGAWADFAGKHSGGDLISLYAAIHDMSQLEAAQALTNVEAPKAKKTSRETPPIEIITDGRIPPTTDHFTRRWAYHNAEGKIIGYVQRYDINGEKEFRPWRVVQGQWRQVGFPSPRPLYNLHELAQRPTDPLMIVEGEKCADIVKSFFSSYVGTTWPNGAKSEHLADWSGVGTQRKQAVLIPDNDDGGFEAMIAIGKRLKKTVETVYIVDVSSKPTKWDIADDADGGVNPSEIMAFVKKHAIDLDTFLAQRADQPPTLEIQDDPFVDDGVNVLPDNHILRNPYFRILGINGEQYWFYKYRTSQVVGVGAEMLGKEGTLVSLAPKEWYLENFEGKWNAVRSALIRIAETMRYDPRMNRKIGAWTDKEGNIIHLGDRLLSRDGFVPIVDYRTTNIYEYCENSIRISKYIPMMPKERASKLIDICSGANWTNKISGKILAGWLFSSVLCASMRWRSHLYIVGPSGSGKSWLTSNIISQVLGDFQYRAISTSTEASIRQGLRNNMVPVVFDECEAENAVDAKRLQAVFDLSRQAASSDEETAITKGSSSGRTISYHVRSAFLFASINPSMTQFADQNRTTVLTLMKNIKSEANRQQFQVFEQVVKRTLDEDFRAAFMTRAIYHLNNVLEGYEVFVDAIYREIAHDTREAEQKAFMTVGAWFLENDHVPSMKEAVEYVQQFKTSHAVHIPLASTEDRLVASIAQTKVFVINGHGRSEKIIGEILKDAMFEPTSEAHMTIRRLGIRVDKHRVVIANSSDNLRKLLKETPFHSGWDKTIVNVAGAEVIPHYAFADGMHGPAVSLPLAAFLHDEKTVDPEPDVL